MARKLPRITIHELEEAIMDSSPIFNLPRFKDIIKINFKESYYSAFKQIIKNALKEFDHKRPLLVKSLINIPLNGEYEFIDNLEAVEKGILDIKYLNLLPTSILNVGGSLLYAARTYDYDDTNCILYYSTLTGLVECQYLARHPFKFDKNPVEDEFTEDSCVYGLRMQGNYQSDMFFNLVIYYLINYMLEEKTQVNYTELPVEIYSGLMEKKSEYDRIVEDFKLSPTQYYDLWR